MKKYYIIIISIIAIVLVVIGISKLIDYNYEEKLRRGEDVYDNRVITGLNPVEEDKIITDFNYSNIVNDLFIGYWDEINSGKIVSFEKGSMPNEPHTYAIHQGEPYVYISFNKNISEEKKEELLKQIKVESNEDITMEITQNHSQYKIDVSDFEESVTYYFGDIAPITIERRNPLEVTIKDNDETLLFPDQENRLYVLLAPEEKGTITLTLPEKMDQKAQVLMEGKPIGNWIDEYNYRIDFSKIPKLVGYAILDKFFSVNGNYLKYQDAPLIIRLSSDYKWVDSKTGEKLTWGGEYQRYYDKILFSPDNQSFIGIIERVDNEYLVANGYIYSSLVLQEKGKEPYIFEYVMSNKNVYGYPVQWINNEEVIYGNKIFNIRTRELKEIISFDEGERRWVHEAIYDSIANKFYILMGYSKNNDEDYYVDRWTYDDLTGEPIIEQNFSDIKVFQGAALGSLTIKIVEGGIYWTKVKDNQIKYVYESRDGYTEERTGTNLIFANNQGAVIWNGDYDYIWWEIGKEDVIIPYKDNMQPFGDDFIYYDENEQQYYRFDPEKGSWVKADYPSDAYLPPQEVNQNYKK